MTTNRPLWTARCKSGYLFHNQPCQRVTPRGALLCADCLSAEVVHIHTARRMSLAARAIGAVAALLAVLGGR